MPLFSKKQYAAGLYTKVCYSSVHNTMLHVSTQGYGTGLTKKYATDLYTTVCYCSVQSSMQQVCIQQYAAGLYTTVCYTSVHKIMLQAWHKRMLQICTQQYATVQNNAVRCVCMRQLYLFHNNLDHYIITFPSTFFSYCTFDQLKDFLNLKGKVLQSLYLVHCEAP